MAELLQKTPIWVYLLFIALLIFGLKQRRDRYASLGSLLLLPIAMLAYSLYDMSINIKGGSYPLLFWLMGIALASSLTLFFLRPAGLKHNPATGKLFVPGSWTPLIIIMGIFFVKYVQGAITALSPDLTVSHPFIWTFSFFNGVFFGFFAGRIYIYLHITTYKPLT